MEETRKKGKGKVIIIILLLLIIIGLVLYIGYDKGILFAKKTKKEETQEKEEKKIVDVDIQSRIVQNLYHKVSYDNKDISWYRYWYYTNILERQNNPITNGLADFSVEDDERIKMQFVAINLNQNMKRYIDCSQSSIPDTSEEAAFSGCYTQKVDSPYYSLFRSQYGYLKSDIERVYKELFGKDAHLDTNIPICMDVYAGTILYYVPTIDMYVEFFTETGGTTGPGGYKATLTKAEKEGNELRLYEMVETYENLDSESVDDSSVSVQSKTTLIYTFEEESDGMYRFVKREKES